ncbi:MAG: PAS domain S-box protein [Thermoanaerobaculia bacterium]
MKRGATAGSTPEERLRASEARLRAILQGEPECVKTVSVDGRLLEMNPAGLRMLEAQDEVEVLGRQISELVHPEDRAGYLELHERAAHGGTGNLEFRIVGLKGTERWMEVQSVALRADDGSVASVLSVTRDISERKRAEAALRESEDRYRDLVENSLDLLCTQDIEGSLLSVNEAAVRLTGYSREALLRMNVADLLAPEARGRFAEYLKTLLAQGRASGLMKIHTAAGETRYWEFNNTLRTEGVCAPVIRGMARDVTAARRAKEALRASETQLRSFIAHAPVDIAMFDNDMVCLAASQRWIDANGRGRPTPVGLSHYEVNPDLPERWREIHRRSLAGEPQASDEDVWTRADGTEQWLRWSVDPWRDAMGAIGGVVIFLEDISERRRAQEAVRAEKAFSEAMLDSLPGVFYLFNQTGRFLRWNRALELVTGYSATEIAALHPLDLFTEEDRGGVEKAIQKVFENGAAEVEAALAAKDGRRTPHYFTGARIVVDGAPCCIGTGIDITTRKLLEAELQQAQRIEAIGRLAGGVAHDFNNILGVILGYGELAQSELKAADPLREPIGEMVKAAQRAADLTRQLQAFSRKQILYPLPLDINLLVADAVKLLGRLIGEDIQVVVRPAVGLGAVRADPGQIERILLNLALNARDAMAKGGTLTLETANADLQAEYAAEHPLVALGRYVMLAVSDTGVGMDEETQRRVFEPFFTTKEHAGGTGLGLASVYGIVKQSGGYIWVYSEPGHGTTFKIYLPRIDELPEKQPTTGPPDALPMGRETILVAEDNPALREVIRARLSERGYTVLLAADGEEALALARDRATPVDLLLTDVIMPRLGGADLARQLAELRPGLRVIFMSGYTDGALLNQGVLQKSVVLLEKPFTGARLARLVREVLDGPDPGSPTREDGAGTRHPA